MTTSTIVRQVADGPILVGSVQGGCEIRCACGALLATQLQRFAVWNVAVRCGRCHALTESPKLPAGYPVPIRSVVLRKTEVEFYIDRAIEVPLGGCVVGEVAVHQRAAEIRPSVDGVEVTNLHDVARLLRRCARLIGPSFDDMIDRHRRATTHRTPPRYPHRLARAVVAALAQVSDGVVSPTPELQELQAAVRTFEFWSRDPTWPEIQASLADPTNYAHNLVNLVVGAQLFIQNEGAVGLVGATVQEGRIADLRLLNGSRLVLVEVKAPADLQYLGVEAPRRTLQLDRLLERLLKDASSQLRGADAGLLIVGAMELSDGELGELDDVVRQQLARRRRPRLMGVGVTNLRFGSGPARAELRVAQNPSFIADDLELVLT